MEALSDVLSDKEWDLPTNNPTFAIGLSFIFLAYFLHPRIESAYQRVRASRAWRAVQKHKRVDVTDYPVLSEAFGVRNKRWDAPRTVTVLLAAFSLGSWVLELSLDIYHVKEKAYLLTQPPPVWKHQNLTWKVLPLDEINPDYDGVWLNLPNMSDQEAKSRYFVKGHREYAWSKKTDKYIDGEIVVASWNRERRPDLSYGDADTVRVHNITCTGLGDLHEGASVNHGSEEWGRVLECGEGPKATTQVVASQPAIILTDSSTGKVHVIVEEVGAHPSFLYSVWTAADAGSVELAYTFHISSTVRLAEAVVTGIVHGATDGGSCFGLLRAFSRGDDTEDTLDGYPADQFQRAKPFGEKPESGIVDELQDVETLEAGVLMNTNALVAFVGLLLLSLVGIGWSMCLKSSVEMDVYDRDELLRAISQQAQGQENDPSKRSNMRIYVQKELGGELTVVISESDDDHNGCVKFLLRRQPTPSVYPAPTMADAVRHALDDHGGAALPRGRPRITIRGGMGRRIPGRTGDFLYPVSVASSVALTASPIPSVLSTPVNSNVGSAAGTPAPRVRTRARFGVRCPPGARAFSPTPSAAEVGSSTGTPAPSNSGSAAGSPVAQRRSPRSPGFLTSFDGVGRGGGGRGGGGGGGGGVGNLGMTGRGPSILFESSSSSSSSSGGGGETDGDGTRSADTEMGSGALGGSSHVSSAFGGDSSGGGGGDVERARGALTRAYVSAFGGDASGDIEMGSLELVHPQLPAFAGEPGTCSSRSNAQGGGSGSGSGAQVDTTGGGQRGDTGGDIEGKGGGDGDDALHFPSDRTTPPASPEGSPLPCHPEG